MHRRIGPLHVIWLLCRVALLRFKNRFAGGFATAFSRKKKHTNTRKGTPRKSKMMVPLSLFLGVMFMFNGCLLATKFISGLSKALRQHEDSSILISEWVYSTLSTIDKALQANLQETENDDNLRQNLTNMLKMEFKFNTKGLSKEEKNERLEHWVEAYKQKGLAAFEVESDDSSFLFIDSKQWPSVEAEEPFLVGLGLVVFIMFISMFFTISGSANQDLGKPEWTMEWLFTFPVPAWYLFLGKLIEYTVTNFFSLFVFLPFLTMCFLASGKSFLASIGLGVLAALYLNIMQAALRLLMETWLRTHLAKDKIKNIQAACTVLGMAFLVFGFWIVISSEIPTAFVDQLHSFGAWILWLPPMIPLTACKGNLVLALISMTVIAFLFVYCSLAGVQSIVRDGLIKSGGAYAGSRKPSASLGSSKSRLSGLIGKELRLLFRDRNFLMQTFVLPVFIIGLQVMINPHLQQQIMSNFHHAAALAFGMGTYTLMFSAFHVLAVEGQSLWLLYTVPQSIESMMLRKAYLWAFLGLFYPCIILTFAAFTIPDLDLSALLNALMVLIGVFLYAFIAAGFGMLSSDPLAKDAQMKLNPEMKYLFMILASMYGFAIYNPSLWGKLAQVILSAFLAYAIWQKVKDHVPYLLEPTMTPPPRISLADGLISVLAFFVLQSMIFLGCYQADIEPQKSMLISFAAAGTLIFLLSLYTFWRRKVPNIMASIGLSFEGRYISVNAISSGLILGFLAGMIGLGYLYCIQFIEPLQKLMEQAQQNNSNPMSPAMMLLLTVAAAPLFEEFIFRGVLFRGLRRSVKPATAIIASAAIFAVVHPPLSVIPVFILGMAAALSFERSKLLIAPIIAHMVYNAIVVGYQLLS